MKKNLILSIFGIVATIIVTMIMASCSKGEEKKQIVVEDDNEPEKPVWTLTDNEKELGTPDFMTFDIARDYSELKEKVLKDSTNNHYVENIKFKNIVNIKFNGQNVVVEKDDSSGIEVKTVGAHVSLKSPKNVQCVITGKSSDGSIKIAGDKKVCLTLKGLDLKNTKGPAICSITKGDCFVVTDSVSVLRDESIYAEADSTEQQKGCIFAEGKLAFSGKAPLKIIANGADAIHSDKSIFIRRGTKLDIEAHGGDAIQAHKNIRIEGGMININSTHAGSHGIVADSIVSIAGGRTVILSNTPGRSAKDKNSRGINCDSIVSITGGIVRVKESSLGGKGIRSGRDIHIENAIVDVLTFGLRDHHTGSLNKGIKAANDLYIESARVRVRAKNDKNEGIEAKHVMHLKNSLVEVTASDDAINTGVDDSTKQGDFIMDGGRLYSISGSDAVDSNGEIHINDGLLFCVSLGALGRAYDCDFNEFYIGPDAIVVGVGQAISPFTAKILKHASCEIRRPLSERPFTLTPADSQENLISFERPDFYFRSPYRVQISHPKMAEDIAFDFCSGGKVSNPKHTFHGLMLGGTVAEKTGVVSLKLARNYSILSMN